MPAPVNTERKRAETTTVIRIDLILTTTPLPTGKGDHFTTTIVMLVPVMKQTTPFPTHPSTSLKLRSLEGVTITWTLAATLTGMALYVLIEYWLAKPADLGTFLSHHLVHFALITAAVWFASLAVIRRVVIKPVDRIFVHLRRIAVGRVDYLDCEVRAREVADVVSSVNHLVTKLLKVPAPDSVSHSLDRLRLLRSELVRLSDRLGDDVVIVMRSLSALEEGMLGMLQLNEDSPEVIRHRKEGGGANQQPDTNGNHERALT